MFTNHPKLTALGAFLAGSVLVGSVALGTGAAHGAAMATTTTTTTPGKGLSDAQYTAKYAWAQAIPGSTSTPLSISSGHRLTITAVLGGDENECSINGMLNGVSVTYGTFAQIDGANASNFGASTPFEPLSIDSGSASCSQGTTETLIGYLTVISAT